MFRFQTRAGLHSTSPHHTGGHLGLGYSGYGDVTVLRKKLLGAETSSLILVGSAEWGAPHLIATLAEPRRPLVWLELAARDEGDPVSQGNKLADAVKRTLGSPLFGHGLPFGYGLDVLKTHLDLLGPFTFALSRAEYGLELAQELLSLQRGENRVVLHFQTLPDLFPLPEGALVLGPEELALNLDEARALAEGADPAEVERAWRESSGALERFLAALPQRSGLPALLRPGSEGISAVPMPEADPATILTILLERERWLDALELAARRLPERAAYVLERAGERLWVKGEQAQLHTLLTALPERYRRQRLVLFWRFLVALALGKEKEVVADVEADLAKDEAPNLRALYAEACYRAGDVQGALNNAERAVKVEQTPLTLYVYGDNLNMRDPAKGYAIFAKGLRLAEARGEMYMAAQFAQGLSIQCITLGRYQAAARWAQWGLTLYHQGGIDEAVLRLRLLNSWAYTRILLGETAGLEAMLREELHHLEGIYSGLARTFKGTLADLLLSQGHSDEALALYRDLWQATTKRWALGAYANLYVRALLEVGGQQEALRVAQHAVELGQGFDPIQNRRGLLALGMALCEREPERAAEVLEAALRHLREPLLADTLAQAALYLAQARLLLGDTEGARSALEAGRVGLQELSREGLHYLAGPPATFQEVFALLSAEDAPLKLRFLGGTAVYLEGKPLNISLRHAELLTALALKPQGVLGEALTLDVYGERGDPRTCKAELGRLRRQIPVTSRPYRIGLNFQADFLELETHLRSGQLMKALALYRGPLLPNSTAPAVAVAREHVDEALRQAVLASREAEALWLLAERLADDLELWEAAVATLPLKDPRRALAQARVSKLQAGWGI